MSPYLQTLQGARPSIRVKGELVEERKKEIAGGGTSTKGSSQGNFIVPLQVQSNHLFQSGSPIHRIPG